MPKILCPARDCLHNDSGKQCGVTNDTIIDMHWVEQADGTRVIGCLDFTPMTKEEFQLITGHSR